LPRGDTLVFFRPASSYVYVVLKPSGLIVALTLPRVSYCVSVVALFGAISFVRRFGRVVFVRPRLVHRVRDRGEVAGVVISRGGRVPELIALGQLQVARVVGEGALVVVRIGAADVAARFDRVRETTVGVV
jgi:hypothetical protein